MIETMAPGSSVDLGKFYTRSRFLGTSPRFKRLDRYEAYYKGLQHESKKIDWDGSYISNLRDDITPVTSPPPAFAGQGVPLKGRRPSADYNLCRIIVDRYTGLLFSDKRRPKIRCEDDPETDDFANTVAQETNFYSVMSQARTVGGAEGSVALTFQIRDGEVLFEVVNPKHCNVTWADRKRLVPGKLDIQYQYPEDEYDPVSKKIRTVYYIYRRVVDDQLDVTFRPMPVSQDGEVQWEPDPSSVGQHGLGRCPVVWVQNRPDEIDIDGAPDCEGAYDSFDMIDRLVSQSERAALYNGDPTTILKMNPNLVPPGGVSPGSDHMLPVGEGGDAHLMELAGTGVDAMMKLAETLRKYALEMTQCVLVDPDKISGAAQSAKAIEYLYQPMLLRADVLRVQYANAMKDLMGMALDCARRKMGERAVPGEGIVRETLKLSQKPVIDGATGEEIVGADGRRMTAPRGPGAGTHLTVSWGPYFEPSDQDVQVVVATIAAARMAGLISEETAVKRVAPLFGIEDVKKEMEIAAAEKAAQTQQQFQTFNQQYGGGFGGGGGNEGGYGGGGYGGG